MCALLENTVEAGLFLMIILHVLSISWVPFHAQSGSLYVSINTGMLSVQIAGLDMLTPLSGDHSIPWANDSLGKWSIAVQKQARNNIYFGKRSISTRSGIAS